ncbi:MAG TPA: hypothetical protein VLB81_02250 [Gaiellales bacterium]|nr:hypothetical protein [Gaiellales bacterium]
MSDHAISLLRRHDPAAALRPLPEAEASAMREAILRSPTAEPRVRRPRWRLVLTTAAAVLLVGGATVYSSIPGDDDAPTVRREYAAVKRTIDLPSGVRWRPLDLPANAVFGRGYALQFAIAQAQCAWYGHWIASARAGDADGVARSYAEARGLRRRMPLHRAGQMEDAGGSTRGTLVATDRAVTAAHGGDFGPLRAFLKANC